jgi:LisH
MQIHQDEKSLSFNRLVYEYLIKSHYDKTAEMFKKEAEIQEISLNSTPSTLLNWYNIFIETAEVRSGRSYVPDSLNRIEGIMLKLENDKIRYSNMNVIQPSSPYQYRKPQDFPPIYNYYNQYSNPDRYSQYSPAYPGVELKKSLFKEYKRIDLNIPKVIFSTACMPKGMLVNACSDNRIYFYNFMNNEIEFDFLASKWPIKKLAVTEIEHPMKGSRMSDMETSILLAYNWDDSNIKICMYDKMQKVDIGMVEASILSYAISADALYVLEKNSTLKIFSLNGEILKSYKINPAATAIDILGKNLLIVENSRIYPFDFDNPENIRNICKNGYSSVFIKKKNLFVLTGQSLDVYDCQLGFIASLKPSLTYKDVYMLCGMIAVYTGNEILVGSEAIPCQSAVEMSEFEFGSEHGMFAVLSNSIIVLYSKLA